MYYLNKIVWAMVNPFAIGMLLAVAGIVFACLRKRKTCVGLFVSAVTWLWFWSMPLVADALGSSLESEFPPESVEQLPQADAIILLGGGMSASTNVYPYANICAAADRAWHSARIFKAGKAPMIVPSGAGCECTEVPFLVDLGVPRGAIRAEAESRNTEENAKFVAELLKDRDHPKVLLVTSSWHMRRALLMYRRYAPNLEIVPAACIFPDVNAFAASSAMWKEVLGYWWYKIARR